MGFAMRTRDSEGRGPPVAVGIDLGTAYSRVGLWKDGDVLIIPNDRGKLATPSIVAFTEECVLVGDAAQEQAEANLDNTIFAPQRLIGSKFGNPWVQWYMKSWPSQLVRGDGDRPMLRVRCRGKERCMRPEEVVTILLDHLRKSAERYLGVAVIDAVITVPAQYGSTQCEALLESCRGARLKVLELVKSPSAAGIAFCLTNPAHGRRNVLVCDMGASYFDFVLLAVDDGTLVERAVGTDYIDLDASLLRFCRQDLKERFCITLSADGDGYRVAQHRLRDGCELAKRKLSQWNQARIEVNSLLDNIDYSVTVSRGHFEDFCKHDVEQLLDPIDYCLEDCGLDRNDVDVVLVGGSARVPRVRRAVREFFYGRSPREVLRPDHAAVLGAAVYVTSLIAGRAGPAAAAAGGDSAAGAANPAAGAAGEAEAAAGLGEGSGGVPVDVAAMQLKPVDPAWSLLPTASSSDGGGYSPHGGHTPLHGGISPPPPRGGNSPPPPPRDDDPAEEMGLTGHLPGGGVNGGAHFGNAAGDAASPLRDGSAPRPRVDDGPPSPSSTPPLSPRGPPPPLDVPEAVPCNEATGRGALPAGPPTSRAASGGLRRGPGGGRAPSP